MSAHLKAFFGVVLSAIILVGSLVAFFRPSNRAPEGPSLSLMERMKTEGVPSLIGSTLDGQSVDISKYQGKVIVINFWASWCEPCIEEVPSLISLIEKMKGEAVLLAVSGDSDIQEVNSFLKAFPGLKNKNIFVMWDENKKIIESYGVERLPETFIVGPDMKLVKKVVGSINWAHDDSVQYLKNILSEKK